MNLAGRDAIAEALSQCVIAKNSMSRVKGFAPVQWEEDCLESQDLCLKKIPGQSDGATEFGRTARIREKARKAFIRTDMSSRVSRAILTNPAPIQKEYGVGDLVCFRTDQSGWSTACRRIRWQQAGMGIAPRNTSTCIAVDRLRPGNAAKALAYHDLQNQKPGGWSLSCSTGK